MDGIVVPLHKGGGGGGDSCDIGNYREITLGSHIGKVVCIFVELVRVDPPIPQTWKSYRYLCDTTV